MCSFQDYSNQNQNWTVPRDTPVLEPVRSRYDNRAVNPQYHQPHGVDTPHSSVETDDRRGPHPNHIVRDNHPAQNAPVFWSL